MKQTRRITFFVALLTVGLLAACETATQPLPAFRTQPIDPGHYAQKADHLLFILDASSSMAVPYGRYRKLDIARGVIQNFNDTLPDADVTVLLRSFGHAASVSSENSAVLMPAGPYSRTALTSAINKVQEAGGTSPLAHSLKDAAMDLETVDTPVAVVIVSDGQDMAAGTLAAAQALQAAHGNRICFHTVQVGDAADGAALLGEIAALSDCGETFKAEDLKSGQAVNLFVRNVLFTEKSDSDGDGVADDADHCPDTPISAQVNADGCRPDTDRDGVFDDQDDCPGTTAGMTVDATGCPHPAPEPAATQSAKITAPGTWLYKDIQFENNSTNLKKSVMLNLNEIVQALEAQPTLAIEIQGHTDGSGTRDFNLDLSRKRAETVKSYFVNQGIDAKRITTRGFGPDRPIESNATKEGRARNRRVEVKPVR